MITKNSFMVCIPPKTLLLFDSTQLNFTCTRYFIRIWYVSYCLLNTLDEGDK
jgi:hypothetical protein